MTNISEPQHRPTQHISPGRRALLAGTALACVALNSSPAAADPVGWYGAVDAGYHQVVDLEAVSQLNGSRNDLDLDGSLAGFARLGYRFDDNWRVELEGGYRSPADFGDVTNIATGRAGICNVPVAGGACVAPDGEVTVTTAMANVIFDFGEADARVRPFIGLGAGAAWIHTELQGLGVVADDTSSELAAQALAGVAVRLSERANLDLTYRYLMTDMAFETTSPIATFDKGDFVADFDNSHTVTLGLRYAFGAEPVAPPPPPAPPVITAPPPRPVTPPAPAQPAAREFVVYFDWDRSDLTAEASSIVSQAASYAKSGRPTRVLVVGHADTSGSAAYNVGLSNRRARTVADALVAQGVIGGVISVDGKGETALARPTADGVREPLNRRATIGINF